VKTCSALRLGRRRPRAKLISLFWPSTGTMRTDDVRGICTYSATQIISDDRYPIQRTIIDKSSCQVCPSSFEVLVPLLGTNFIENKDIYLYFADALTFASSSTSKALTIETSSFSPLGRSLCFLSYIVKSAAQPRAT
jgi:hypothetical protein